ncbi:MAG: hypothetical protein WCJ30_17985, partial [Deltaproteobacteria bacterium]
GLPLATLPSGAYSSGLFALWALPSVGAIVAIELAHRPRANGSSAAAASSGGVVLVPTPGGLSIAGWF